MLPLFLRGNNGRRKSIWLEAPLLLRRRFYTLPARPLVRLYHGSLLGVGVPSLDLRIAHISSKRSTSSCLVMFIGFRRPFQRLKNFFEQPLNHFSFIAGLCYRLRARTVEAPKLFASGFPSTTRTGAVLIGQPRGTQSVFDTFESELGVVQKIFLT